MGGGQSLEVEAFLHKADGGGSLNHRGPTPNLILLIPSRNRGMSRPTLTISIGNAGEMGHLKWSCPMLKGKQLFQGGNA